MRKIVIGVLSVVMTSIAQAAPEKKPFWWGISTSSYQTENVTEKPGQPGYFETDWDLFFKAGKLKEHRGDATRSFTEVDRDVATLKALGVTHYRFGIEWARVEPKPGEYNKEALAHYVKLVDKLKAAGIEPIVCFWHFTFPDWTTTLDKPETNAWLNPKLKERWQPFVELIVRSMKDKVQFYTPQNEPNAHALASYFLGSFPPGKKYSLSLFDSQVKGAAEAYITAAKVVRAEDPGSTIITIQNVIAWEKAPWDIFSYFYKLGDKYNFQHLDLVKDHTDWIGFNYYYKVRASPFNNPRIDFPEGLETLIGVLGERYKKPLIIMENGVPAEEDEHRVKYMKDHIAAALRARDKGADLRGYFYWSLIDNYEWAYGYGEKFGIHSMDPSGALKPKPSADVYRQIVNKGSL